MYLLAAYVSLVGAWTLAADFGVARGFPLQINGVFVGDKLIHFFVVGGFAVVLAGAIRGFGVTPRRSLFAAMLIAAILATVEEFTNLLTPHRGFSVLDLVANYSGILTLGTIWGLITASAQRRQHRGLVRPVASR